jgi:hypothetical protein
VFANNQIYTYSTFMCGIFFGVAQVHALKLDKNFNFFDYRFLTFIFMSISIPVLFLLKKYSIENENKRTYALNRPYFHIIGDYLCAMGTISLFSMLNYYIMTDKDFMYDRSVFSLEARVIGFNLILLTIGIVILRIYAARERHRFGETR